jgi:hypothetical protein
MSSTFLARPAAARLADNHGRSAEAGALGKAGPSQDYGQRTKAGKGALEHVEPYEPRDGKKPRVHHEAQHQAQKHERPSHGKDDPIDGHGCFEPRFVQRIPYGHTLSHTF